MTLIIMLLIVLALLWLTKCLEERLGDEERFDQLITVQEEKRGRFTVAGGRANKWCS